MGPIITFLKFSAKVAGAVLLFTAVLEVTGMSALVAQPIAFIKAKLGISSGN